MAPPPAKQNTPASDPNPRKQSGNRKEIDDEEGAPSHNLWVGNLSAETTDSDLMDVFAKYGALDSVTTYSSRNYAFLYFKNLDDARRAKEALQGHIICGSPIKIEFARPAKAGKHLWVGAISSSVTKEQLEAEFLKFGKIEEFKFLRDRNSALVDYYKLEDAVAALKNMNGKRLGGEQIRVDFLRSQPARRDNWSDFHEMRDGRFNNRKGAGPDLWMPPDFPESSHFGSRRHPSSQHFGGRRGGEGQPSNVLWVGYPPSVQIDEQMLHNAMILFGEIERIKSFPSRHYSFVEFRSVDEARRAKEGLQGRLFNDPRIQILFSSSEFAPGKDNPAFFPEIRGPRPDMFFNELPFRPGPMEYFGHTRPMAPNNFPGPLGPNGMPGPNMFMRPFGPRGFDPLLTGPEFNDLPGFLHNFVDANRDSPMGANWRRPSPTSSGMLPSPLQGMRPPGPKPMPGMWDGFEANPFQREPKRSRMDGPSPTDDISFHARKMDNQGTGDAFGFVSQPDRGASTHGNVQGQIQQNPVGIRGPSNDRPSHSEHQGLTDNDHCWRGVIAKGGTPVCHARCIPIGKGVDSPLPEVVNCSARTGLDMLTKHYSEASGFDIVFFLPDSEEDFASYTEFLRYLGMKNRAGVAKFDDGTTLFLVPPSEFLTKVLNVSGPERLYGVVLRMPQQTPSMAAQQPQQPQQSIPPHYIDRQQLPPSQTDYNSVPQKEDQALQMDYNRVLHEGSLSHSGSLNPLMARADELHATQSAPPDYAANHAAPPQSGVSLTPELIATLAALIPANTQSPAPTTGQLPMGASARPAPLPPSATPDKVMSQGWRQEQVASSGSFHNLREEQTSHPSQQLAHQYNTQLSQFMTYANVGNGTEHSAQLVLGASQAQDPALNMQQATLPTRPANNFMVASLGGQYTVPQANQPYQFDASQNTQNYGMMHASDAAAGVFRPQAPLQPNPMTAQVQSGNIFQPQMGAPLATDKVNMEYPNQVQQLQSALSASGQGTSEGEADKNQRYQSTLQFAASLLLQIQQQQQQGSAQSVHGSGNQQ